MSAREVYLEPGDFHFGAAPLRLKTLLGSCVTVTLWHPQRHIGGMCHIQFARAPGNGLPALDGRYAEHAFALFDQAMARHGTQASEYEAKLFGGGNMFAGTGAAQMKVGADNIEAARALLAARGLRPRVEHVGDAGHRKLVFDLADGKVWLEFSRTASPKEIHRV